MVRPAVLRRRSAKVTSQARPPRRPRRPAAASVLASTRAPSRHLFPRPFPARAAEASGRRPGTRTLRPSPGPDRPISSRSLRPRPLMNRSAAGSVMPELKRGDCVYMRSARDPLPIGERLGRGGQGTVFGTELHGRQLAVKWYRPSASRVFDNKIQTDLVRLVEGGRPKNQAFIWPIDLVSSPGQPGFGYVMPRLESRFVTCF